VSLALNVLAVLNVDSGNYASARTMYENPFPLPEKTATRMP